MAEPVCDLVLLSWNHLEETQTCLESLWRSTDMPSRLYIVDNGSEPHVRRFLQTVRPQGLVQEVTLLQHETNEGFPKGMNRGIRASRAPYVCLLNNDLVFTSGWLSRMLDVAQAHPEIGVLNPASSTFGQRQPAGQSLEAYAQSLEVKRGGYVEVGMCIGFCLLITREVINRIGLLNEEVERIFFEDEDFSMRAQQAGYQCVVVEASYVYHAEHQTVQKMPEREALFSRNRRWCEDRWGRRLRIAWPRFSQLVPGSVELRKWLEQLIGWARRRTHVYVYCPTPEDLTPEMLFRSVQLVPHADIHWYKIPATLAPVTAMGYILRRRKKPFDLIVAPEAGWARAMHRLQWLHRAAIVPQEDEPQLIAQWQQKSRIIRSVI